jgi:hypothetical protein
MGRTIGSQTRRVLPQQSSIANKINKGFILVK